MRLKLFLGMLLTVLYLLGIATLSIHLILGGTLAASCWFATTRLPSFWLIGMKIRAAPATGLRRIIRSLVRFSAPPHANVRLAWESERNHRPLFVPVHLANWKSFWPDWAFNIRIITTGLHIERSSSSGGKITVNLGGDDYAIYNNEGKRWLRRGIPATPEAVEDLEQKAWNALTSSPSTGTCTVGNGYPLRWASGGVLPVVEWLDQAWVCCFLRDINPMGWNIANGASESEHEHLKVNQIIEREFTEELVILDRNPLTQQFARLRPIRVLDTGRLGGSSQHTTRMLDLRRRHDGLRIYQEDDDELAIQASPLVTKWDVRVVAPHGSESWIHGVLPSINAAERGIELIRVVRFNLAPGNILLDGEILEKTDALARRPVALFRLDTLRSTFEHLGNLGELTPAGCRVLPPLHAPDFHLFPQEIQLRERRLRALRKIPEEVRRNQDRRILSEIDHLAINSDRYLAALQERPITNRTLRTLCPVTWKTLEMAFRYKII